MGTYYSDPYYPYSVTSTTVPYSASQWAMQQYADMARQKQRMAEIAEREVSYKPELTKVNNILLLLEDV